MSSTSPQNEGLKGLIVKAGVWTLAGHGADILIRLVSSLLLTRLLLPEAFGLMAIASTVPAVLSLISDIGIRANVIRRAQQADGGFLATVWTLQVLRGVVLAAALVLIAAILLVPAVRHILPGGSVLADPQLPMLLAIMGLLPLISGFDSVALLILEKNIQFRPTALRNIISRSLAVPAMLAWCWFDRSVWALAAGAITGQLLSTLLSHYFAPLATYRLTLDRRHAGEMLGQGKWITFSSMAGFVVNYGDRLALSALLTVEQMGFYAIAALLADVLRQTVQKLHGQLTLPVMSKTVQFDETHAAANYYRFRLPFDVLVFLACGFLVWGGPAAIRLLYDDRYLPAGPILGILALSALSFPFRMINMTFLANGDWKSYSLNSLFLALSFVVAITAGYLIGGWMGAVWGICLHSWPAAASLLYRAKRRGWIDLRREVRFTPLFAVGLAGGYVFERLVIWLSQALT